ncbi:TraB/GumN family protein [Vibrio sp. SM6]|uniref:TraB/GumN family protein n=1 Tax=Vibrio agarilyticus TaxID=2726741 RepID=A0A7X8TMT7_9VIBR|nr:TraB/GumN family protein [Vibrio agarilyticus]NLS11643.1 TraB/GumN family protein [Vibrio agarilyticus]
MRRFWFVLLNAFLPISLSAAPAVWEITQHQMTIRIIGSIHVGDASFYPLPKAITEPLTTADGLIIEADLSTTKPLRYPKTDITTDAILTQPQKKTLERLANTLGLPAAPLLESAPWLTAATIELTLAAKAGMTPEYGVDQHLVVLAQKDGVPLLPLETAQYQLDLLTGDAEDGKALLQAYLQPATKSEANFRCMIESWQAGNTRNLAQFANNPEMSKPLKERLLYLRNQDWARKIMRWTVERPGEYVMVVGALHLVGQDNLLELLKNRGFSVKRLTQADPISCHLLP